MSRLNVFATAKELTRAAELATQANNTPVIAFSGAHAMTGGASADAWRYVHDYIDKIAYLHELPEISGRYGLDLQNGEFLE